MQETRVWSWVRKIPWRREWLPIPVFFPREFHGQRSLVGYSALDCKELDSTERLRTHTHRSMYIIYTCMNIIFYQHQRNRVLRDNSHTMLFIILNDIIRSYHFLNNSLQLSLVQLFSHVWLFVNPWITARQASLSITNSWSLLKLMSIELVIPSNHLILCRPLLLLPPIPPSIRVFSNKSTLCMRWPKYWSFSLSISPSNELPGLIFRMDWLDLLAVQGTLKSLLHHHSAKASILRHSAFFTVQLTSIHDHWKNHSLD